MTRALVLNASYEPLSVVSERRAVILVLNRKASLVVSRDETWSSESTTVELPSVGRRGFRAGRPGFLTTRAGPISRGRYSSASSSAAPSP
jgi:hypothetical protein